MRSLLAACLVSVLALSACDDDGGEAFATFQDCFDDHHEEESLSIQQSIVICCLDHPINGATEVCGADANSCGTYVMTNLSATSASASEVVEACQDYAEQKDQ